MVAERDRYWADVERQARVTSRPIKPQLLVRAMRELLDDDVLIVADPGTPTPYLGAQYELRRAGRTTIIPRAHGGLGYAIPGVVGACYARPERRVDRDDRRWQFRDVGRGVRDDHAAMDLPIVMIQCSNGTFGWIKELQHLYHGDRYFSVDFNPVDYAAIARGFGFQARQVVDPEDVRAGAPGGAGGRAAVLPRHRDGVADHGDAASCGLDRG